MIYYFDIDGTICSEHNGEYAKAEPFKARIKKINKLYDKGNEINFYTSRGAVTKKDWTKLTKEQLKNWGVKYNKLFNKPFGHFYIDNKAINSNEFFKYD